MKSALAERLLAKVMEWTQEEVTREIPFLIAMANFKYNEYQQFSPGIRFIESLAQWLIQFETKREKELAYEFVRSRLIFLSNNQMSHLVNLSHSQFIEPAIRRKVAKQIGIPEYFINRIQVHKQYKKAVRQSLFIGLTDGSRIDQLRRYAELDNEQVLTSYYLDKDKANDLKSELEASCDEDKFTTIFLLDDFTASGKSYARSESGEMKGKILKVLKKIFDQDGAFFDIVDQDNFTIHIIFYIATEGAIDNIRSAISEYATALCKEIEYSIDVVQLIDNNIKESFVKDADFLALLQNNYDDAINDKHYKKGNISDSPFLGFGECGLPIVLSHNTPNNSLPIIWSPEDLNFRGLFPRITRHK